MHPVMFCWPNVFWRQRVPNPKQQTGFWRWFPGVPKNSWPTKHYGILLKGGGAQHAECDMCVGPKKDIRASRSLAERHSYLQRYLSHVYDQWRDRMIYWAKCTLSVCWASQAMKLGARLQWASVASSCIACAIDGVDQAKFRIPRLDAAGLFCNVRPTRF